MKKFLAVLVLLLLVSACTMSFTSQKSEDVEIKTGAISVKTIKPEISTGDIVLPIAEYGERLRYKAFGEYIQDRFKGFHVGDDIEYQTEQEEIPVVAIANGTVIHKGTVEGYGGLIIVKHIIDGKSLKALYGHIDLLSSKLKKDDNVIMGQFLANLGDPESIETDGERKHLHFGIYEGDDLRLQGYEASLEKLANWINPYEFFVKKGVRVNKESRSFNPDTELGGSIFGIQFSIPNGWEVEYIPSLKALNLFTLSGSGSARERSQILVRYFDAQDFLTLSTVTVHNKSDLKIGTENYTARRYVIEKKSGIPDFVEQPAWRNQRHTVTDFRKKEGFNRYYVVAANPSLDITMYEELLASMRITKDL